MKYKTKNFNLDNVCVFLPIRKGSKRIKNKNTKSLPNLKLGITELKINQLNKFRVAQDLQKKT